MVPPSPIPKNAAIFRTDVDSLLDPSLNSVTASWIWTGNWNLNNESEEYFQFYCIDN